MSSDSDIECDTENEEQEDATSASEGFNHTFSVQSSSEGRIERVSPPPQTLPRVCLWAPLIQNAAKAEIPDGPVEVLTLEQAPVRFGTPLLGS